MVFLLKVSIKWGDKHIKYMSLGLPLTIPPWVPIQASLCSLHSGDESPWSSEDAKALPAPPPSPLPPGTSHPCLACLSLDGLFRGQSRLGPSYCSVCVPPLPQEASPFCPSCPHSGPGPHQPCPLSSLPLSLCLSLIHSSLADQRRQGCPVSKRPPGSPLLTLCNALLLGTRQGTPLVALCEARERPDALIHCWAGDCPGGCLRLGYWEAGSAPSSRACAGQGQLIPLVLSAGHRHWLHSNPDCSLSPVLKKKKKNQHFLQFHINNIEMGLGQPWLPAPKCD